MDKGTVMLGMYEKFFANEKARVANAQWSSYGVLSHVLFDILPRFG